MTAQILGALAAVILGVGACLLYFVSSNLLLDRLFADGCSPESKLLSRDDQREALRPWLFLLPALLLLFVYLIYPVYETIRLSFHDFTGERSVGLRNYTWAVQNPELLQALGNNAMWLVVVPSLSVVFGMLVAVLTDRVWWGTVAKSLIFMPMAISFVGASVIWKFVYDSGGRTPSKSASSTRWWCFWAGNRRHGSRFRSGTTFF